MARPWYPHYPGDYERKTPHLSLAEHGAYRLLLDRYYTNGGPLPANEKQLLRVCRASDADEKAAVRSVLRQFFELRDGAYSQNRADREIAHADKLTGIRQTAGAIGGARSKANRVAREQQLPRQFTAHTYSETSSLATPLDLKRELWSRGRALLQRLGIAEGPSGELLGKWRRDHGDLTVLNALATAEANCVSDVVPYIEATLRDKGKKRQQKQPKTEDECWADRIEAYRLEQHWDAKHWGPPPGQEGYRGPQL